MTSYEVRALVSDPSSALSDPSLIIYNHWLQGHSIEKAAQLLCSAELFVDTAESRIVAESILMLYRDEVQDAHRHFKVFEALLEQPDLLGVQSQIECPVNDVTQRHKLIALYYGFDSRVLREFMGLKLTAKLRSNLDDISDRTHVPIRSVRRQFDNLRRVHARFDEVSVFRGNNTQHISEEFCLPTPLARRYAAASFLLYHRFDLETSDRKYQFLSWGDCEYMAIQVMAKWVTRPVLMMSYYGNDGAIIDSMFGMEETRQSVGDNSTTIPSSTEGTGSTDDGTGTTEEGGTTTTWNNQHTLSTSPRSPIRNHLFRAPLQSSTSVDGQDNRVEREQGEEREEREGEAGIGKNYQNYNKNNKNNKNNTGSIGLLRRVSSDSAVNNIARQDVQKQEPSSSVTPSRHREEGIDSPYGPNVNDVGFTASVDATGSQFALERRSSVDLAPAWLSDVRDMKTQIMGSSSTTDGVVERVVRVLRLRPSMSVTSRHLRNNVRKVTKDVVRNMLIIGGNLSQAKELRDFFEDVMEKVCDPLLGALGGKDKEEEQGNLVCSQTMEGGVFEHTRIFFRSVFDASCEAPSIKLLPPRRRERLLSSWRRYLDVIGCCTLRMMRKRLKSVK